MNPSRILADQERQGFEIGGNQFREGPVTEDIMDEWISHGQFFQNVGSRGIAGFCLLSCGKAHLFKKDVPQLLGRIDIERLSRFHKNILLTDADFFFHFLFDFIPPFLVCGDAGDFHG